jgi:plasmid stabilization system protein ParE
MTFTITWRPQAQEDFDKAYAWHERQKNGLGDEFAQKIDETLERLRKNARIHRKVFEEVRRAVVEKFTYCVYYYIEDDVVVILSVFHDKRNPDIWKSRI